MKALLFVFLGGGIGTSLRYFVYLLINKQKALTDFPWATFTVNIIGSLCIGIFFALASRLPIATETRLFFTVGLCGGFTTFSTFSLEAAQLLKAGLYGTFFLYSGLSFIIGLLAVFAGAYLITKIVF